MNAKSSLKHLACWTMDTCKKNVKCQDKTKHVANSQHSIADNWEKCTFILVFQQDCVIELTMQVTAGSYRERSTLLKWIQLATGSTHREMTSEHTPHVDAARNGPRTWGNDKWMHSSWIQQPATRSHTYGNDMWTDSSCGYSPQQALTYAYGEKTSEHTPHVNIAHNGPSHLEANKHKLSKSMWIQSWRKSNMSIYKTYSSSSCGTTQKVQIYTHCRILSDKQFHYYLCV